MKKTYQAPQVKDLQVMARACGSGGCCSGNVVPIEKQQ